MIEAFRMVTIASQLLIVIYLHTSHALSSYRTGRFPLLLPNVTPYRVSAIDLYYSVLSDIVMSSN